MTDAPVGGVRVNREGIWPFRDGEVHILAEANLTRHRVALNAWVEGRSTYVELSKDLYLDG